MNITYVVSLQTAKELEVAGWNKKTQFAWVQYRNGKWDIEPKYFVNALIDSDDITDKVYPAPLATEILEELPGEVNIKQYPDNDGYQVGCNISKTVLQTFKYNNLCDALGEIWLDLKKNNLLGSQDGNI